MTSTEPRTGAWYPDPTGRHELRWADPEHWSDDVSDGGVLTRDPVDTPPPAEGAGAPPSAGAPRRRGRWWVVALILVGALVPLAWFIASAILVEKADRYHADLTKGSGDFPTSQAGGSTSRYAADGYHVTIPDADASGSRGVQATGEHTALGVRIDVRGIEVPAGAAFGPACWSKDLTHGYALLVSPSGRATLVEGDGPTFLDARTVGVGHVAGFDALASHRMELTCQLTGLVGAGRPELVGTVDGHVVVRGRASTSTSAFTYTGFTGHTSTAGPTQFVVHEFWRVSADDLIR